MKPKQTAQLPLVSGFSGKIPCDAEFVRHNMQNSDFVNLDNWLKQSYQYFVRQNGVRVKQDYQQLSAVNYLYLSSDKLPVLGVLLPSYDKFGREYPLISCCRLFDATWPELISGYAVGYADYLHKSFKLFNEVADDDELTTVFAEYRSLAKIPLVDRLSMLATIVQQLKSLTILECNDLLGLSPSALHMNNFIAAICGFVSLLQNQGRVASVYYLSLGDADKSMPLFVLLVRLVSLLLPQIHDCLLLWPATLPAANSSIVVMPTPFRGSLFDCWRPDIRQDQEGCSLLSLQHVLTEKQLASLPKINSDGTLLQLLADLERRYDLS